MSRVLTPKKTDALKQIIKNNRVVVLKLGATWCAPCISSAPLYEKISRLEEFSEAIFLTADIETECGNGQTWGEFFQCSAVPMFIVFFYQKTEETFMGADLKPVAACLQRLIGTKNRTTAV